MRLSRCCWLCCCWCLPLVEMLCALPPLARPTTLPAEVLVLPTPPEEEPAAGLPCALPVVELPARLFCLPWRGAGPPQVCPVVVLTVGAALRLASGARPANILPSADILTEFPPMICWQTGRGADTVVAAEGTSALAVAAVLLNANLAAALVDGPSGRSWLPGTLIISRMCPKRYEIRPLDPCSMLQDWSSTAKIRWSTLSSCSFLWITFQVVADNLFCAAIVARTLEVSS